MCQQKKAILTFDLEFWYNGKFFEKYLPQEKGTLGDFFKESVFPVLKILKDQNHKATFFVLGNIAEKYPLELKKIWQGGHEIASHGYSHRPLERLSVCEFEEELKRGSQIVKAIIGKKPIGFRAPNFSLNAQNTKFLKIMKDNNFVYDSSIHPLKFFQKIKDFTEIYPSLGGFYFRVLPLWVYVLLIKILSRNKIPVLYFHPYELFATTPRLKNAPLWKQKIKYWGTKNAWKKFNLLMKKFKFISVEQYLYENYTN